MSSRNLIFVDFEENPWTIVQDFSRFWPINEIRLHTSFLGRMETEITNISFVLESTSV